jgi:class 3 adenylate cyclase
MTVLFADLQDSCGHAQNVGEPEEVVQLEADLFRAINPVVLQHYGHILRYQGDSILVAFNLRGNDARHAEQAVCCALAIQRAVRSLNILRRARDPRSKPLELPIGINTGEVALAHLLIPGRREVTPFGDPVNLAKRIQETFKAFPDRGQYTQEIGRKPPTELILVGEDTLLQVDRGVFRAFGLGEPIAFKGYEGRPLKVYSFRPAIPCRTSFIGVGSSLRPQPGVLALDVGNRAEPGILNHHQPGVSGCAAALVLEHPEWVLAAPRPDRLAGSQPSLEIVVHAEPDFDCCAATFLALEVLSGRCRRWSSMPPRSTAARC